MSEIHNQREIELLESQLRECRAENAKLLEEAEYELMYGYDMASADYRDIVEQQDREISKLRAALEHAEGNFYNAANALDDYDYQGQVPGLDGPVVAHRAEFHAAMVEQLDGYAKHCFAALGGEND